MFYRIIERQGYIRSADLSAAIRVRPSSVTRMLQKLHEAGFIAYEKYRHIALTDKGLTYGRFLVWRDETLKEFFRLLRTPNDIERQVEGIEHYITPVTMKIFQGVIFYFREYPQRLDDLDKFRSQRLYPENEDLTRLRAWQFRHSLE